VDQKKPNKHLSAVVTYLFSGGVRHAPAYPFTGFLAYRGSLPIRSTSSSGHSLVEILRSQLTTIPLVSAAMFVDSERPTLRFRMLVPQGIVREVALLLVSYLLESRSLRNGASHDNLSIDPAWSDANPPPTRILVEALSD
jgi:hypothetical protein